jgi:hypothetical protein
MRRSSVIRFGGIQFGTGRGRLTVLVAARWGRVLFKSVEDFIPLRADSALFSAS